MQITDTIKTILYSIQGRAKKYGKFWLSRHEYEKFWLTERSLRTIIKNLQKERLIQKIDTEKYMEDWKPRRRNIWIITDTFTIIMKWLWKSISDMNEKIVGWCKNQNPIQTLRNYWIEVFNWGRLWEKRSKVTVNARNWAITNWKTWEKWNLFNYIRNTIGQWTYEFFTNNING